MEDILLAEGSETPKRDPAEERHYHTRGAIAAYLLEHSSEYKTLSFLRDQGWKHPAGDTYFSTKRKVADKSTVRDRSIFYKQLKEIMGAIQRATTIFQAQGTDSQFPTILDLCMAPGAFLETALRSIPNSDSLAFTLPQDVGGYSVTMPVDLKSRVECRFLDINLLAADMGAEEIDSSHPEAADFLPLQLKPDQLFDLVLCDGQVLRTHQRPPYREAREATRLTLTQLALGLEHVKPGGSMLVLLHNLERWEAMSTVWKFSKFSHVTLFKPKTVHAKHASFYLVATQIQSDSAEAVRAIQKWKRTWRIATFGSDEEYRSVIWEDEPTVEEFLDDFGQEMMALGKSIWEIQAKALSKWLKVLDRRARRCLQ